jgi:tryptophan synthase beta chain
MEAEVETKIEAEAEIEAKVEAEVETETDIEIKIQIKDNNQNILTHNASFMIPTYQHPDTHGYYGAFGGAYIPEMLHRNVSELEAQYRSIISDPGFQQQFQQLLRDYVGRPTPLYFAQRLSEQHGTNIYLKREDLCHTGAHKINNTIGQILLAQRIGKKRIIAETGAGQHGVATATVCALMGVDCIVFMGEKDMQRQAPNVARMKMLGATVVPATSGSKTLKDATNEAIRDWINHPNDTHYIIGSVVGPHPYPDMVARFQSVISEEIKKQLSEKTGSALPTHIIACVGGGSNAAGAFYHFLDETSVQLIAVEAAGEGVSSGKSAATTQLGTAGIIHGSKTLLMQTPDGQVTEPHSISAGLDYPGIGPLHAHLFSSGRGKFLSATDAEALEAAFALAKTEGIIPALETAHALAALNQLQFSHNDTVVICLSGRGDKDLATYMEAMKHE